MNSKKKDKFTDDQIKLIPLDIDDMSKKTGIIVDKSKQIGQGGFALVYLGTKDKRNFALKVIILGNNVENDKEEAKISTKHAHWAQNEMIVTSNLKNVNCVKSFGCFSQANSKIIILEYAPNKDLSYLNSLFYHEKLFQYLNFNKEDKVAHEYWIYYMSESFIRFFIIQIINALSYLHEMKFVHCDLKLENLLLMKNFQIKLSDFALSTSVPSSGDFKLSNAGTQIFMSPEHFDDNRRPINVKNAYKIDYYSLGVILYKMITNENVIKLNKDENIEKKLDYKELKEKLERILNEKNHIQKISDRKIEMTSDLMIDLLKSLLNIEIEKRADILFIQNHPWLKFNQVELRFLHEIHENDYLKFLLELQKFDFIKYKQNVNCFEIDIYDRKIKLDDTFICFKLSLNKANISNHRRRKKKNTFKIKKRM